MSRRPLLRRMGLAIAIGLGLVTGIPYAASAERETLTVLLGTQRRVALPADVSRIAVGDPAVTRVQLLTSRAKP